jgi:hypothetical protein
LGGLGEVDRHGQRALAALQTKGWINMWLQHSADEPLSQIQYGQITALYNRLKGITNESVLEGTIHAA